MTGSGAHVNVAPRPTTGAAGGKQPRLRILFPDVSIFYGPIARDHTQIMRHLDPELFDVALLANSHGQTAENVRRLPHVRVRTADFLRETEGRGWSRRLAKVRAILSAGVGAASAVWQARRMRPDIIHGGLTGRIVLLQHPLRWVTGAKLIACVHVDPLHFTGLQRRLLQMSVRRADAVITVSEWVRQRVISMGADPQKVHAILNVSDLDRFKPGNSGARMRREYGIPDDAPLVVLLGRVFPWKGQGDLVEAIARVRESVPNIRALMIGWDDTRRSGGFPYSETVRARIEELGLQKHVILDAARPEAPEIMAAADIFAAPSTEDPCPLVVLEALASGKPVVGYRSGGIPEEVSPENDEWLVEPGDIAGLADRIQRLADDPELRRSVGARNRKRAEEHFYESRLAEENVPIYYQLLGHSEAPSVERAAA